MRTLIGLLALASASCGAAAGAGGRQGGPATFAGRITYDARHPTLQGASRATEVRPARHVDVALVGRGGAPIAEGQADAEGRFALDGPADAAAVRVCARIRVRGHDVAIARDANGRDTHCFDTPVPEGGGEVRIHADDDSGNGGALHVVDTMLRGVEAVRAWIDVTLPPVFAYWIRGLTREWSFYRGERPAGSGRYALELLGGDPGQASISDTDEHDEVIILHEVGHFVMDRISADSSVGGMHPQGALLDPGLAWEEGRASWFAAAVLGDPVYRDTIGVEPWGRLRLDANLETDADEVVGMGSEASVGKVLWDLSDGRFAGPGDALPDSDEDGVALGPAAVLRAMASLHQRPGEYSSLPSFLRHLVRTEQVSEDALASMLRRVGEPESELLADGERSVWPIDVAIGDRVEGTIDGLTQPAPSGGLNLPTNGLDAVDTYRVRVTEAGMLIVRLHIDGSGQAADRTDLELELRDLRSEHLASSTMELPVEAIGHLVSPGWYIVRVRDAGNGNRAAYRLEVLQETLGGPPIPLRP